MKKDCYKVWNREKNKWEKFEKPVIKYGKSRTDKSKFRPNVNQLTGADGTNNFKGEYDFVDGKDDGTVRNYLLRNKGADIVELERVKDRILEEGDNTKDIINSKVAEEIKKISENKDNKKTENTQNNTTETE